MWVRVTVTCVGKTSRSSCRTTNFEMYCRGLKGLAHILLPYICLMPVIWDFLPTMKIEIHFHVHNLPEGLKLRFGYQYCRGVTESRSDLCNVVYHSYTVHPLVVTVQYPSSWPQETKETILSANVDGGTDRSLGMLRSSNFIRVPPQNALPVIVQRHLLS